MRTLTTALRDRAHELERDLIESRRCRYARVCVDEPGQDRAVRAQRAREQVFESVVESFTERELAARLIRVRKNLRHGSRAQVLRHVRGRKYGAQVMRLAEQIHRIDVPRVTRDVLRGQRAVAGECRERDRAHARRHPGSVEARELVAPQQAQQIFPQPCSHRCRYVVTVAAQPVECDRRVRRQVRADVGVRCLPVRHAAVRCLEISRRGERARAIAVRIRPRDRIGEVFAQFAIGRRRHGFRELLFPAPVRVILQVVEGAVEIADHAR